MNVPKIRDIKIEFSLTSNIYVLYSFSVSCISIMLSSSAQYDQRIMVVAYVCSQ